MSDSLSIEEAEKLLESIPDDEHFFDKEEFENYLTSRTITDEKIYGRFENDVTILSFFNDPNNETVLTEILRLNRKEEMGIINIPGTDLELVNYSYCKHCNTVHSYKDLINYYSNPLPNPLFKNRLEQFRKDTTISCKNCKKKFIPSLIIVHDTPKNETQFLCRIQTVEEIESYMLSKNKQVLSKNPSNRIVKDNWSAIKNDLNIQELKEKPSLIANFIQYTPANLCLNFIEGRNLTTEDFLFGHIVKIA
jgi:hypothetical protein